MIRNNNYFLILLEKDNVGCCHKSLNRLTEKTVGMFHLVEKMSEFVDAKLVNKVCTTDRFTPRPYNSHDYGEHTFVVVGATINLASGVYECMYECMYVWVVGICAYVWVRQEFAYRSSLSVLNNNIVLPIICNVLFARMACMYLGRIR